MYIWLIVFLPVVGSIAYIVMEILPSRRLSAPKVDLTSVFNPGAKIKRLEKQLKFSNTFSNRVALADACLEGGFAGRAVELYEESLTGAFSENEHVHVQLIDAWSRLENYEKVIEVADRIRHSPQFVRSPSHILYARALEQTGDFKRAEEEFKRMKGRFSCFEHRYEYGLFLQRAGRDEEAKHIFEEILDEAPHLSDMERKNSRMWIAKVKEELTSG